jgi:hypothetical protein
MTKTRTIQMTAMILALAVAMTFTVQRKARANDTTALLGAIVAGALVYEALDDDGPRYRPPRYYRYEGPTRFERAWAPRYYGRDGYATPFPQRYDGRWYDGRRYDGRYDGPPYRYGHYKHGKKGVNVGVYSGRRGTSLGFQYRDRTW